MLLNDGDYRRQTLKVAPDLKGVPSYVGHPATAEILGLLGVNQQPKGSNAGPVGVGASYLAVRLKNPNRQAGFTTDKEVVVQDELEFVLVTKLADLPPDTE